MRTFIWAMLLASAAWYVRRCSDRHRSRTEPTPALWKWPVGPTRRRFRGPAGQAHGASPDDAEPASPVDAPNAAALNRSDDGQPAP